MSDNQMNNNNNNIQNEVVFNIYDSRSKHFVTNITSPN